MSPRFASILVEDPVTGPDSMRRVSKLIVTIAALACAAGAWGQVTKFQSSVKHRPTFIDADFAQIATYLGELTSRTFELEPGVCATVTKSWDKSLSSDELYRAFLQIARELGYVVVEDGLLTKIQLAADTPKDPRPPCRRYPVPTNRQN
jgi:type II secretory pathway component GspD/PulD (secretin)